MPSHSTQSRNTAAAAGSPSDAPAAGAPTRRALLAAAALSPAACLVSKPRVADVPPARRAGMPAPAVEALLGQMTLEEKIGQMTQVDRGALKDGSEIQQFFIGSVLSGGDSLAKPNAAETWAEMYDRFQSQALATRLGIPLLYGIDAVHGHGSVRGAVIFPHNVGMGCTRSPELVEAAARITAREVAGTGIDWTFAPCIAVTRDDRWGRAYESFGEEPELAETLGAAAVRGLQNGFPGSQDVKQDGSAVLACAKHFLADGGTAGGKDRGDARIDEAELRRIHLPGYAAAIKAGVATVMVSYSSWNEQPMHGNRALITGVLKGELGFSGFVVSDWAAIDRLPGDYVSDIEAGINAGIDMVMVPIRYREFTAGLKQLVQAGRVPMTRIDDAVRRILTQKVRFALWERPFTDRALTAEIGSPAHRAVARDAVRRSAVLLKNDGAALPLRKEARVHVCGAKADDIGIQCGGWSVGWRGRRGASTVGTTIRQAIAQVVGDARVDFSKDAAGAERADAVVVVVGEDPYAEEGGDRAKLGLSADDQSLIAAAKRSGKPVIVVLITGRPLVLDTALDTANAFLVVWLPGTEGGGIADVLYGAVKPTGKLSCSWPRNMTDIPVNVGDPRYAPLFEYGFGLSYP
ncbi:MAG: glycoside hydrolase family 3 N-terminal domain-containing protein [Pseudomonadota bacterium]